MSKYIYLLGAGASCGVRNKEAKGLDRFVSGMPLIDEIKDYLREYCESFRPKYTFSGVKTEIKYPYVYQEMCWLRDVASDNYTVDTYASMLNSTYRVEELQRFKKALAIFFSLIQSYGKRDRRYDSFLSNVHDEFGRLRDCISVFTWNYDRQIEYALNNFALSKPSATLQLKYSNISCKNLTSQYFDRNTSNIIKLNGTACFRAKSDNHLFEESDYDLEVFERILREKDDSWIDGISYAWEEADDFYHKIKPLTGDTEMLIIIGYSLPYVNYPIDKLLVDGMKNLKSIVIQDKYPDAVRARLMDLLSPGIKSSIEDYIRVETDTREFFIPAQIRL